MATSSLALGSKNVRPKTAEPRTNYTSNVYIIAGRGPIFIEGPVSPKMLSEYTFDSGLSNFRSHSKQFEALQGIAALPNGYIYIVRSEKNIVGYVIFCPPDEYLKWGNGDIPELLELGAIEITPQWRREGLGIKLLREVCRTSFFEDNIIISMEYYWHWDIDKSELSLWEYRNMLKGVLGGFGFELWETDDPDIKSHPANTFMVRVGKRVPQDKIDRMHYISKHRQEILGDHW